MKLFPSFNSSKVYFASIFLLLSLNITAQPDEEFRKYKELAPKADVISTGYNSSLNLSIVNDNLKVGYATHEEILYQGSNVSGFSERSIGHSEFFKLIDYKAYTLKVDKNKYKKLVVSNFTESSLSDNGVFHDDNLTLSFVLPQIEKGSKSVIEAKYEIMESHILPILSVSPYLDFFNVEFSLTYDTCITLEIDTVNMKGIKLDQSVTKTNNIVKYVWKFDSPKKYSFESSGPENEYLAPQIIIRVKSYVNNGIKVKVLENLDDLNNWYCSLISKTTEKPETFKALSDSIAGDCKNDLEKASKIYYWVQKNIRYIAFEEGYAGFIPQKASLVYKDRYGDCKGMANLLYNLLLAQNIDANLCWIGTRDLPYKYSEHPNPIVDNHMITAIKTDDKYLFLDATHSNLPFGVPSPFIQGKETLISKPECNGYEIVTVPNVDPENNVMYDSCSIKIKDRDLIGNGFAQFTGFSRMSFVDNLSQKGYKNLLNYCREYLIKGNNKFVLDTVWLENVENINEPLNIYYKFRIPDYVVLNENECYINMNLEKLTLFSKINKDRNVDVLYRYKNKEINIVNLDVESMQLENKSPEKIFFENKYFTYENFYITTGKNIVRYQKSINNCMTLPPNEFIYFNKLLEVMQESYQKQLTFKVK